jgi:Family of unknown function (DUF5683)
VNKLFVIVIVFFVLGNAFVFSQDKKIDNLIIKDTLKAKRALINPLAPAKAAFYSAILPGLGQAYNKKYWKIPIVYGAIGTGVAVYVWNDNRYDLARDAYKRRLLGVKDGSIYDKYSEETLINAQKGYQRARDIGLLLTIGMYVLNIIDANVDAHLKQFNVDDNLSIRPDIIPDDFTTNQQNVGLTLNYRF